MTDDSAYTSHGPEQEPPHLPQTEPPGPPVFRLGFLGAVVALALVYVVLFVTGGISWAVSLAIPFALGMSVRLFQLSAKVHLLLIGTGALVFVLATSLGFMMFDSSEPGLGLFCAVLGLAVAVPVYLLGFVVASVVLWLRGKSRASSVNRSVGFLLGFVLATHATEKLLAFDIADETLIVSRSIDAPIEPLWHNSMFRGEEDPPPRLPFQLGMTRAIGERGEAKVKGDVKTFRFRDGHLSILVTDSRAYELLEFTVTAQHRVEDRAARFVGGQMLFEKLGDQRTRIAFNVDYTPLMTPRFLWRPLEVWAGRAVLEEVLDRMESGVKIPSRRNLAHTAGSSWP